MSAENARPPKLVVDHVSHSFQAESNQPIPVLNDVNLEVLDRQFVTVVGPSGCGKSTLFNVIAGLLKPMSGSVLANGEVVTGMNRAIAYMLQKDLLLDWRDVLGNVTIGAEILGVPADEARREAIEWLGRFGLEGFEHQLPFALSGGMRQRVALLRTLLTHREILLLDEPFGSLDAQTRSLMHEFLLSLWETVNRTILFVTHDVEEALILGDEIYVMTARPMHVKSKLKVHLPRPRSLDALGSMEFMRLKSELVQLIREESVRAVKVDEDVMARQ